MPIKIPIDDLPEPPKDTHTRVGFAYAFETTIPVLVTRDSVGLTIKVNIDHDNLGDELKDISALLTRQMVERLVARKDVWV